MIDIYAWQGWDSHLSLISCYWSIQHLTSQFLPSLWQVSFFPLLMSTHLLVLQEFFLLVCLHVLITFLVSLHFFPSYRSFPVTSTNCASCPNLLHLPLLLPPPCTSYASSILSSGLMVTVSFSFIPPFILLLYFDNTSHIYDIVTGFEYTHIPPPASLPPCFFIGSTCIDVAPSSTSFVTQHSSHYIPHLFWSHYSSCCWMSVSCVPVKSNWLYPWSSMSI